MGMINSTEWRTVVVSLRQEVFLLGKRNKSIAKRVSFVSSSWHSKEQRLEERDWEPSVNDQACSQRVFLPCVSVMGFNTLGEKREKTVKEKILHIHTNLLGSPELISVWTAVCETTAIGTYSRQNKAKHTDFREPIRQPHFLQTESKQKLHGSLPNCYTLPVLEFKI